MDYKEENQANCGFDIFWQPPWDPGICRRKLVSVQRMREKQNAERAERERRRYEQGMSSNSSVMSVDDQSIADDVSEAGSEAAGGNAGGVASSLSAVDARARANEKPARTDQLMGPAPASTSGFAGPSSFTAQTSKVQEAPERVDFMCALQRPGNVPALSSSVTSQHAGIGGSSDPYRQQYGQSQYRQEQQQQQYLHQQQLYQQQQQYQQMPHQQQHHYRTSGGSNVRDMHGQGSQPKYGSGGSNSVSSMPAGGYPNAPGMIPGVAGGVAYQGGGGHAGMAGLSNSGGFDGVGGVQYLAQQRQLQRQQERSQQQGSMDKRSPHMMSAYDQQMLIEQQQKQLAALQQQHQQQLAALQQQQQLVFQQQQQQFLNQAQYGQTGNGYYYVTSADGTPMMVQGGGAPMGTSYDASQSGSYRGMPQQGIPQPGMPGGYDGRGQSGSMRGQRSGSQRGSYRR